MDELPPDAKVQANFALAKGKRDSDRLVEECLKAIQRLLEDKKVIINGRECHIRHFSGPKQKDDGTWFYGFDIKKPGENLSHIEFSVTKIGWEMDLTGESA